MAYQEPPRVEDEDLDRIADNLRGWTITDIAWDPERWDAEEGVHADHDLTYLQIDAERDGVRRRFFLALQECVGILDDGDEALPLPDDRVPLARPLYAPQTA